MSIARLMGGLLLTAIIVIFGLARLAFEMIGASTAPDDFALLKQRMPVVLNWLFSTPWPVPALLLIMASIAAAWLIMTGTRKATEDQIESHPSFNEEAIIALIEQRLANLPSIEPSGVSTADIHRLDEKMLEVREFAKAARECASGGFEANVAKFKEIEVKIDRLVAYAEQHVHDTNRRFEWVDGGFRAIFHRERLACRASMIEEQVKWLLRIRDGGRIEDWGQWEGRRHNWIDEINAWLELGEVYRDGCRERVMRVDTEQLHGDWPEPDDAFINVDTMMAYRKVGVILGQFRAEQEEVEKAVITAAYHRPSMKSPRSE